MAQPSFYLQINGKGLELGVGLPEVPRERAAGVPPWLVTGDHAERFLAAMEVATAADVEWTVRRLARPPLEFRGLDGDAPRRSGSPAVGAGGPLHRIRRSCSRRSSGLVRRQMPAADAVLARARARLIALAHPGSADDPWDAASTAGSVDLKVDGYGGRSGVAGGVLSRASMGSG